MSAGTVLLVEDDEDIADMLALHLSRSGYRCVLCDGCNTMSTWREQPIDLVLLDIVLNGADGFEVCRQLREVTDVPVVFLSDRAAATDKVRGLELGCDDYIVKPFSPTEVVARVADHLRRYRSIKPRTAGAEVALRTASLEIDEKSFTVRRGGEIAYLSAKEFQILKLMVQHPDRVFQPDEIYRNVWRPTSVGDVRTVMVHISNLRKKIELDPAHPRYILTIRGAGYKFNDFSPMRFVSPCQATD